MNNVRSPKNDHKSKAYVSQKTGLENLTCNKSSRFLHALNLMFHHFGWISWHFHKHV